MNFPQEGLQYLWEPQWELARARNAQDQWNRKIKSLGIRQIHEFGKFTERHVEVKKLDFPASTPPHYR